MTAFKRSSVFVLALCLFASEAFGQTPEAARQPKLLDCAANQILKRNAGDTAWTCAADVDTDDQTAAEVPFTPNGSIAGTNVQAAIQEVRDEAQPLHATLTAWSNFNTSGCLVQTAQSTFAARSFGVGSAKLTVSNGNCVAGNPTYDLGSVASTDLSDSANLGRLDAANVWTGINTLGDGLLRPTSPRITTGIRDANGNFILGFTATGSAVNYFGFTNAAAADPATITFEPQGDSANINLLLKGKGTGSVCVGSCTPGGPLSIGEILFTAETAPSTPASGKGIVYVDSTSKNLAVKDDAGVVKHGVQTVSCSAGQQITAISDAGVATCTTPTHKRAISFTVGSASGSALTAGATTTSYITVPIACTITAWNLLIDAGTITVKFWKVATGTAIPTSSNSINTNGVSISSGTAIHSTTLTDFTTTTIAANDIMAMNVTTVATAKVVNGVIECNE